ncbi:g1757 [Coccomyxa viridis]|uniref:G1757 protein n=1 Tax=Coccomyxa viridis TaxID=1274662 RepID=A0ABP1FQK3_9CHLO
MEQCAAVNHSVALSRKRKSANEQETEEPSVRNRAVRRLMTALDMPRLAASSVTNPAAEETLLLSELGLTDELLAEDQFGDTYMGTWAGKHVAVKVYNLREDGSVAAYKREKMAYKGLKSLQGVAIPYFLRSGLLAHSAAPVIVSSMRG